MKVLQSVTVGAGRGAYLRSYQRFIEGKTALSPLENRTAAPTPHPWPGWLFPWQLSPRPEMLWNTGVIEGAQRLPRGPCPGFEIQSQARVCGRPQGRLTPMLPHPRVSSSSTDPNLPMLALLWGTDSSILPIRRH